MSRRLVALVISTVLPAVALGQPKKPKVVEEERDGKTVRVLLLAPGDGVTAGDVRYTFLPLYVDKAAKPRGAVGVGYKMANVGPRGKSIRTSDVRLEWVGYTVEGEQNETIKSVSRTSGGPDEMWPGVGEPDIGRSFKPAPDKEVTAFIAEFKSPDEGANVWRVVYPRRSWQAAKRPNS